MIFLDEINKSGEVLNGPLRVTEAGGDFHPFVVHCQLAKGLDGGNLLCGLVCELRHTASRMILAIDGKVSISASSTVWPKCEERMSSSSVFVRDTLIFIL